MGSINAYKFFFPLSSVPNVWQHIFNVVKELVFGVKVMRMNKTNNEMVMFFTGYQGIGKSGILGTEEG